MTLCSRKNVLKDIVKPELLTYPLQTTKFQAFNVNIVTIKTGEFLASFRESPFPKLYLGVLFLTFKLMQLIKYTLFSGMFGIKTIAETPAFRKCHKKIACQMTFKKKQISLSFLCQKIQKDPRTCKSFITFSENWCFSNNFNTKHSWKKCILYELH